MKSSPSPTKNSDKFSIILKLNEYLAAFVIVCLDYPQKFLLSKIMYDYIPDDLIFLYSPQGGKKKVFG